MFKSLEDITDSGVLFNRFPNILQNDFYALNIPHSQQMCDIGMYCSFIINELVSITLSVWRMSPINKPLFQHPITLDSSVRTRISSHL